VNLAVVAGESSQLGDLLGDLQEGLSSLIPRLGKIQELQILSILVLRVITNTAIITIGDVTPAQAEELVIDTGEKDIPVEASAEKTLTAEPALEVDIQEAITISDPEAPVVTSEIRQF